jgi:hypothetical protein
MGKLTGSMNNEFFGAPPIKDGVVRGSDQLHRHGPPDLHGLPCRGSSVSFGGDLTLRPHTGRRRNL